MRNRERQTRSGWARLFLATAVVALFAVSLIAGVRIAPRLQAQAPTGQSPATQSATVPQWQIAAGGKMAFDVASVKLNKSGGTRGSSNITGFNAGPTFSPTGGLLSATNYPLINYMVFAYKLNGQEILYLISGLPEWAKIGGEKFDIEARGQGNPTKDQYRLMMQALLADRFKLSMHHETRQGQVLALVLSKAGTIGPQLLAHSADEPCSTAPTPGHGLPQSTAVPAAPSAPSTTSGLGLEPIPCGIVLVVSPSASGRIRIGARNVNIEDIGTSLGGDDAIDRPVIDRTGLRGTFDFTLEWSQQIHFNGPPPPDFQPDPDGPSLATALQKQLGLKLEPQKAPVDILVIDHVEEPSPN